MDPNLSTTISSLDDSDLLSFYHSKLSIEQRCELYVPNKDSINQNRQIDHVSVENYIATVNTAFPLFQSESLLERLENGTIYRTLTSGIYSISAKLTGNHSFYGIIDIDTALTGLLGSATVEVEGVVDPQALNQWQTACLLSWYGLHQYPGKGEALHIAVLIRKAYQYGLHQIDSDDNRASFGWDFLSEEILEAWRHVWWCLYFLDCYVSFSNAIPHQVESQSQRTALCLDICSPERILYSREKMFLPSDPSGLWKMVQDIASAKERKGFSMHMAISTLLKDVLTTNRLHKQNPCQSNRDRMCALEDHLAALQLALPTNYLRCTRDLLGGESEARYHSRLLILLKMSSMRLVLRLPYRLLDTDVWEARWEESLDICYRMVSLLQNWDTQHLRAVDPALCFVGISLLVCLHLHSLSSGVSHPALLEQLSRRKDIVRLFLQQYAKFWALPRLFLGNWLIYLD